MGFFNSNDEDAIDQEVRRNPSTALELIEQFMRQKNEKHNQTKFQPVAGTSEDGELFMVTLQSVRTDTHMIRAKSPEEAMIRASALSDDDETGKFHRRFETLDPMVLRVPTAEELSPDEEGEIATAYMEKRSAKPTKNPEIRRAINRITGEASDDDSLIDDITKYLQEKASEYD